MPIRQNERIRRLEKHLRLFIWNEFIPDQDSPSLHVVAKVLPNFSPVFFAPIRPAGDDQAIILAPLAELSKCRDEVFETLIRSDSAEKKKRLFILANTESLLCLARGQMRVGDSVVNTERDHGDPIALHAEFLDEFNPHLFRMDK